MSFQNNNNYQSYGNFMNSQINNNPMTNPFTVSNNGNMNNNIIDPNKQIQYGAVNYNQPPITKNTQNIIPRIQMNQGAISPQLNPYGSNVISSPQNRINPIYYINRNGIIYNNNQWINSNPAQNIPNQNNINNNNNQNLQRNFFPITYNGFILNNRLNNMNFLINEPYRTLFSLRQKREREIGTVVSIFVFDEEKMIKKITNDMRKDLLNKEKELRKKMPDIEPIADNQNVNIEKINIVLEDMCIYGNIEKMKIIEEKKENNPQKIIKTEDALTKEKEKKEQGIFALGLISSILERNDIETVIETGENGDDYEDMAITSLQFLTNGLIGKKKYELIFDFEEERVDELLFNSQKYEEFKDTLRSKISEDYNVPKEKIIIAFPQKGSFHVQVIFQSDEFNDLDLEEFKLKFQKDTKYKELSKLKSVQSGLIMGGCRLSKLQLDPKGNRFYGWPIGETRGGEPYEAPEGWIGIGLNVFDKFWDDRWLDMKNLPGEWVVAYHGVGSGLSADEVKGIPGAIIGMGFKAGRRQAHKDCDDQFHPGQKVGEGVYCTPSIKVAEAYAGVCIIGEKKYKTVIMSRVNPKARRHCNTCPESRNFKYWVVNGTTDEIRPYRILYKRC